MQEIKHTTITLRLEGIKHSLGRSRVAFLVSTIISLAVILGIWNRYFAWDRDYAMQRDWKEVAGAPVTQYLREQLLSQWVQAQQISSTFFGIRVSASDATFLASCALTVTMVWFFWCTRRENHSIGALLRDTRNENEELKKMVFHGIVANLVFTRLSDDDQPVFSLASDPSNGKPVTFLRNLVRGLSYLPVFTILASGIVQLLFFAFPSPFDPIMPLVLPKTSHWTYLI
ncbi:MAG: hypothetical protein ABI651_19760, partial [Verrucomicrobiota bacterium]